MSRERLSWKTATALCLTWCSALQAGCPDPDRPTHEVSDLVESLHYYADGAVLCIVTARPDWCGTSCRAGYRHVCGQGGQWNPLERCTSLEKKDAKLRSASSASNLGSSDGSTSVMRRQVAELQADAEVKHSSSIVADSGVSMGVGSKSGGGNGCAKDNSGVMQTLETAELRRSPVTRYAAAYAQAGGPAPVARAARSQIDVSKSELRQSSCNASINHQKACAVLRDVIKVSEHMALAAECEMRSR